MEKIIKILDKDYEFIQSYQTITIPDSFVVRPNKTMLGNGEAKLYIGQDGENLRSFFGSFPINVNAFMLKKDWKDYMRTSKEEYFSPSQNYAQKINFEDLYIERQTKVNFLDEKLNFILQEQKITPPRVYLKSISPYFKLIRELGLPNFSSLNVKKLKYNSQYFFYFKPIFKK